MAKQDKLDEGLIQKDIVAALCAESGDVTLEDVLNLTKPTERSMKMALTWVFKHFDSGLWCLDLGQETVVGCKGTPPIASLYSVMLSRLVSDKVLESRQDNTSASSSGIVRGQDNASAAFVEALEQVMKGKIK